jgi:hypothetical protein
MRQGWMRVALCAALALSCAVLGPLAGGTALAAKTSSAPAGTSKKAAQALRQFTGYVTALDSEKITVEKRGKKPTSRVFMRHAEMSTRGDVEKDARVTVYYREEGGRAVAHKVVVKAVSEGTKSRS